MPYFPRRPQKYQKRVFRAQMIRTLDLSETKSAAADFNRFMKNDKPQKPTQSVELISFKEPKSLISWSNYS